MNLRGGVDVRRAGLDAEEQLGFCDDLILDVRRRVDLRQARTHPPERHLEP